MSNKRHHTCCQTTVAVLMFAVAVITSGAGCSDIPMKPSDFVVLGRGLTNQVELGMTLKEVKKRISGVNVEKATQPLAGKAVYQGTIPSLGLSFTVHDPNEPIEQLVLNVDANSNGHVFGGRLSCGLDFGASHSVSREDVEMVLGAPADPGETEVVSFLRDGKDVIWHVNPATEILYYPSSGVFFRIYKGNVQTITLVAPFVKRRLHSCREEYSLHGRQGAPRNRKELSSIPSESG